MNNRVTLRVSALMGFLVVALGAFGAHGLKEVLRHNNTTNVWDRAVFYHAVHAVMMFLLATQMPAKRVTWLSFLVGIVLFSGSLYLLAVTNARWLGAITPFGGASFLAGWICLMISPRSSPRE